jgi:hypothetical protein
MKSKLIHEQSEKAYVVIFDTGDEVTQGLLQFAKHNRLSASRFSAIGGFSEVTLGYFDIDAKEYRPIPIHEQVEVLSLVGNIALDRGEPRVHAHVVVGKADGTAHGGHLLSAKVRPTLEVVLVESPKHLERVADPHFGIPLIRL